jgi:hypothetical protein
MAIAHALDTGNLSNLSGSLHRSVSPLVDVHQCELAAALAGASTRGVLATLGLLTEEEQRDERSAQDGARNELGADSYNRAFIRGAAMAPHEAGAYTIRELDRVLAEAAGDPRA